MQEVYGLQLELQCSSNTELHDFYCIYNPKQGNVYLCEFALTAHERLTGLNGVTLGLETVVLHPPGLFIILL